MRLESLLPNLAPTLRGMATSSAPNEGGGVLVIGKDVLTVANRSETPTESFDFGTLGELEDAHGQLAAIFHTHPEDQPPSMADLANCASTMLPWVIAGPNRIFVIYPERQAYGSREFAYGSADCFQLVADFYAQERGIFLPWFERPAPEWWHDSAAANPYFQHAAGCGFQVIPWAECGPEGLQPSDVVLMKIGAKQTNHAAVYLGGGNILHHLWGHLSRVEQLDHRFQRLTTHICRFRGAAPC
jgi:cell wall-associated NlpC family hydrolase